MKCRLNHSSTLAIIFRVGASLATTIEMHRRPLFSSGQKRRRVVTSHRQNVGITTRGGFIIPANDLTKRTRRPGMGRVESQSPLSRGRLSCRRFSRRGVILPSIFRGAIYVGPIVRSAHLYTP